MRLLQIRRSLAFNPSSSSSPNHHTNILAAVAAIVLLVAVVLPAEYGVDPTDIGRVLRMTEMGEIKQQLAAEAAADAAAVPASPAQVDGAVGIATAGAAHPSNPAPAPAPVAAAAPKIDWRDEVPVTFTPGEGTEIKLKMVQGAKAEYSWVVEGGEVNFDAH